jgi:glycogen debranching enzyme/CRP-like cAMP-binding protein
MDTVEHALGKIPLLSGLTELDLRPLASRVEVHHYAPGSTIVSQNDRGGGLYLILSGRVHVLRHTRAPSRTTRLREMDAGDFFGEMALLEDAPRSADVIATTQTTCAVLSRDVFLDCLLGNKAVAMSLLSTLSRRVRSLSELVERPQVDTPATPRERERRILQQGETAMANDIRDALLIKEQNHFTLSDRQGNIPIGNTAGLGLYLGDTRHLSGYEVSLGRVQAVDLVSTAQLGYAADHQLTNRDMRHGRRMLRKETLLISRERIAHEFGFDERITLHNFNFFPIDVAIQLRFAADFADVFEVRGVGRAQRGAHLPVRLTAERVVLGYEGRDNRTYETELAFSPTPTQLRPTTMLHRLHVEAVGRSSLEVRVTVRVTTLDQPTTRELADPVGEPGQRLARAQRSYDEWLQAATVVESDNALFDAAATRSLKDLRLLVNNLDGQWFFGAGTPWYSTLFGRDSLITGLQTLAWNPDLAGGILRLLARYQGTRHDTWRDEEPGKILHELRTGELARSNSVPHTPYYGTIDATPLFIMLAADYFAWTGDIGLLREIRPNLEAALRWCLEYGDIDGDGYIEYARRSKKGLANQGWKDSGEGILFSSGRLPKPPIALVEVQAYLFAAFRGMARLLRALDPPQAGRPGEHSARSLDLELRALRLKERFNIDFWMPAESFYALGLDGVKQQIDTITSNPGHALWTGIVDDEHAPALAAQLLSDELFSGWGVRTLSSRAVAYNPLGYHLGTVWPHDNSIIVAGLRRYGFDGAADQVLSALFGAALHFPYFRLPELFSGIARTDYGVPVGYPVACSPQAWAAATLPFMLTQTLGLRPRDGGVALDVVRPSLPTGVNRLQLRGLRVGSARLDLTFERADHQGERTRVTARTTGTLEVRPLWDEPGIRSRAAPSSTSG